MSGRLNLTDEAAMCDSLRAERDTDRPYGVYLVRPGDERGDLGRMVEQEVFLEFFGNTPTLLEAEYRPYDPASQFLLLVDHDEQRAAGAMRIIQGAQSSGLKSIRDATLPDTWNLSLAELRAEHPLLDETREQLWDLATLGIRSNYRGPATGYLCSTALYHGLYWWSLIDRIEAWIAVLDENVLQALFLVNAPFKRVLDRPPLTYLGSPESSLVYLITAEIRAALRAGGDNWIEGPVLRGEGLHDLVSFPDIVLTAVQDASRTDSEATSGP